MQRTLREKRVGSGMVVLLTAHQLPFQNAGKVTTPAADAKAEEVLQADCSGQSCGEEEETTSRRIRSGKAFLLLPILPTHANLPLSFSEAPRGTSWALRRARKSSLLLGRWPSEGTGKQTRWRPVRTWPHWTNPHPEQHWDSTWPCFGFFWHLKNELYFKIKDTLKTNTFYNLYQTLKT